MLGRNLLSHEGQVEWAFEHQCENDKWIEHEFQVRQLAATCAAMPTNQFPTTLGFLSDRPMRMSSMCKVHTVTVDLWPGIQDPDSRKLLAEQMIVQQLGEQGFYD